MCRPAILAIFSGLFFTQANAPAQFVISTPWQGSHLCPPAGQGSWFHFPVHILEDVWLESAHGEPIHSWWLATQSCSGAIWFFHGNADSSGRFSAPAATWPKVVDQPISLFALKNTGVSIEPATDTTEEWLPTDKYLPPEMASLFDEPDEVEMATELVVCKTHLALVMIRTLSSETAKSTDLTFSACLLAPCSFSNLGPMSRRQGTQPQKGALAAPRPGDFLRVLAEFLPPSPNEENPFRFWVSCFR